MAIRADGLKGRIGVPPYLIDAIGWSPRNGGFPNREAACRREADRDDPS
jgi:hypothetical protein